MKLKIKKENEALLGVAISDMTCFLSSFDRKQDPMLVCVFSKCSFNSNSNPLFGEQRLN